jgi:hypothetical protein
MQTAADDMTVLGCTQSCIGKEFAGLEYGRECWCSIDLNTNSQLLPNASCTFPCAGDPSTICGGSFV